MGVRVNALLFVVCLAIGCGDQTADADFPPPMTTERLGEIMGFEVSETLLMFRWSPANSIVPDDLPIFVAVAADGRFCRFDGGIDKRLVRTGTLDAAALADFHDMLADASLCKLKPGVRDVVPCGGMWQAVVECDGAFRMYGGPEPRRSPDGTAWLPRSPVDRVGNHLLAMRWDVETPGDDGFYGAAHVLEAALLAQ